MKTSAIFLIACTLVFTKTYGSPETGKINTSTYLLKETMAGNFVRLDAHRQQQGVGLSWTMLTSAGITGFVIERSYDGIYFEEIDQVGSEASGRNRYNDNAVYPGYIYYRVTAIMENGSVETSATVVVRIVSRK